MSFSDDVKTGVDDVLAAAWSTRKGTVVPETDDIALSNGAVSIDATYLYADLADSSSLGQKLKKTVAANIVRSYLNAASRILRHYNGEIRSFDGDRVLAIFIGGSKNTNATRAALALNWAVDKVLAPKLLEHWPTLGEFWEVKHGVGIDTGEALLVRGGVRDNNDLVSIGSAPNVAAKLSELRCSDIHITKAVYQGSNRSSLVSTKEKNMWSTHDVVDVAGTSHTVYSSDWRWAP
jgi:adenylate cyclase